MKHLNKARIQAVMLLIYFMKAFNTISHKYIKNTLLIFKFSDNILNWINKFFTDRNACVMINGTFTDRIFLRQGIPQGDIISPYIFIICVEIPLIKINHTIHIKGIIFANQEEQIETFVDDTSIIFNIQWSALICLVKCLV